MRLSRTKIDWPFAMCALGGSRDDYAMLRIGGEGWQRQEWILPSLSNDGLVEIAPLASWAELAVWEALADAMVDAGAETCNCLLLVRKIGYRPNNDRQSYARPEDAGCQWEDIDYKGETSEQQDIDAE